MQRRPFLILSAAATLSPAAHAHHGWSSFDQDRPLYLEGRARNVAWRNPHAEFDLEIEGELKLPTDLKARTVPPQSAPVDAAKLLAAAQLPTRKDRLWHIELAPLTRLQAWAVPPLQGGGGVAVLGYTFAGEKGDALLRVEVLWLAGKAYGLRSSPA